MASAFQLDVSDDGVALLTFDIPGQKVNTLSGPVIAELSQVITDLESREDLHGLIFRSGKTGQFIAGADLGELSALAYATPDEVKRGVERGHELFDRLSRLPFPTVALVDGHCMGGGTELILSMDQRLLSNNSKAGIALPEVKLGIIPGWGGTQRLPRLIGVHHAIRMITTGATIRGSEAVSLGLVFDVVSTDQMIDEARRLIEDSQEHGDWKTNRERRNQPLGMTTDQMAFTFSVAEGYIRGKTGSHYPAPLMALKSIREGINLSLEQGLAVERDVAVEIMQSPAAANLIGVFFKGNSVDRNPGVDLHATSSKDVLRTGVLGTGLMGAGIATAHARRGIPAAMVDTDNDRIAAGLTAATKVVQGRIAIGRATQDDLTQTMSLLSTSTSQHIFADCDVVIEAVPENEPLKTRIYGQLAEVMRPDAILASNTSTISITRMAHAAPAADRFVGMHFFSPVDRMALVEVIRGEQTSDETVATIVALAKRIGKTPIVVRDCAGFLVNRVLMPYMAEAVQMLTEGASMDAIDKAATRFGMPVGPIALHDMVGIDVACFAGDVLVNAYADRAVSNDVLSRMVELGRLGKKTGSGFRRYVGAKGRPAPDPEFAPILAQARTEDRQFTDEEITDRLFLAMMLEAVRALQDEIISEPAHVDMAMILGTGFPPFRGGLLGWCDNEGAGSISERADRYASLGKRFESPDMLTQMAISGERFFPLPAKTAGFGG
jgi:3-hydroxyacyl-CoA dehydrogenase / enoyl-CoA hydratase / 3-hydroxybutyryl-CoA epimerase / enoyl-CoA isomerase